MEIEAAQQRMLDEIIRRIVQVAAPEQIILFGSAARGEVGPDSDIDLMVVKSGAHRRRTGSFQRSALSIRRSGGSGGADGLCVGGGVGVTKGSAEPSVVSQWRAAAHHSAEHSGNNRERRRKECWWVG